MILTATPVTASAAAKSVTVKTQAQLNAALKNPKVTTVIIKTSKGIALKVKAGDYEDKKLVIAAPNATVNNYGDFKKVSIHDAKVVYDRGVSNEITVSDNNDIADTAAAREVLGTAGNTVKVCYDATDASDNAATQKTVTYTAKANVVATQVAIKQNEGGEILSAAKEVAAGELIPDGSASYDGAVINGATPDINKLIAAFKNNSGQTVEVDLAFVNPDTALTVTGNVNFTATAKTADSYDVYNGAVNIRVKEATPTADDVKLITEDLDQVAVGKTAFASAYANMQYSMDGEHWTDISTTPFDVPESKKIYVHKTGTGTDPSDALELTVTDANIGTKKTALTAVSITTPKLVLDV